MGRRVARWRAPTVACPGSPEIDAFFAATKYHDLRFEVSNLADWSTLTAQPRPDAAVAAYVQAACNRRLAVALATAFRRARLPVRRPPGGRGPGLRLDTPICTRCSKRTVPPPASSSSSHPTASASRSRPPRWSSCSASIRRIPRRTCSTPYRSSATPASSSARSTPSPGSRASWWNCPTTCPSTSRSRRRCRLQCCSPIPSSSRAPPCASGEWSCRLRCVPTATRSPPRRSTTC